MNCCCFVEGHYLQSMVLYKITITFVRHKNNFKKYKKKFIIIKFFQEQRGLRPYIVSSNHNLFREKWIKSKKIVPDIKKDQKDPLPQRLKK